MDILRRFVVGNLSKVVSDLLNKATQIDPVAAQHVSDRDAVITYFDNGKPSQISPIDDTENLPDLITYHYFDKDNIDKSLKRLKKVYFLMNGSPTFPMLEANIGGIVKPCFLIVNRTTNTDKEKDEYEFTAPGVFDYKVPKQEVLVAQAISDILFDRKENIPENQS